MSKQSADDIEPEIGTSVCPDCEKYCVVQFYVSERYKCLCCDSTWSFSEWGSR